MKLKMIKLKKYSKEIIKFVKEIYFVSQNRKYDYRIALVFRVSNWKQDAIKGFLNEYKIIYVPKLIPKKIVFQIMKKINVVLIAWGYNNLEDKKISYLAKKLNKEFYRIEDGFIRSVGLGSMHALPLSICLDKKGMYFDSTKRSDLEDILNFYEFDSDTINRARRAIEKINSLKISKYNHVNTGDMIEQIYGVKSLKRVLVIGQVEDDASIKMGCNVEITNNDLVRIAYKENPNAQIIYKPHPDVLVGKRSRHSNPEDVKDIALIIEQPLSIADALETVDHVYTITSLSGFEALLKGIKVTTIGAPFYSGWGLTDDRTIIKRRNRILTIEQLFAGAYILYPRYYDPVTKKKLNLELTIDQISSQLKKVNNSSKGVN